MVKCLGKMPIIFIVFLLIGCTQNKTKFYDPSSDPDKDLSRANVQAANSGKNILLQVGGDWWPDSRRLDNLYSENRQIKQTLKSNYEIVRVSVDRNKKRRDAFLDNYPKFSKVPHIYILSEKGELIQSQNVEKYGKYPELMRTLLENHVPKEWKVCFFLWSFRET